VLPYEYDVTDGWGAYRAVAKAGYEHEAIITGRASARQVITVEGDAARRPLVAKELHS